MELNELPSIIPEPILNYKETFEIMVNYHTLVVNTDNFTNGDFRVGQKIYHFKNCVFEPKGDNTLVTWTKSSK